MRRRKNRNAVSHLATTLATLTQNKREVILLEMEIYDAISVGTYAQPKIPIVDAQARKRNRQYRRTTLPSSVETSDGVPNCHRRPTTTHDSLTECDLVDYRTVAVMLSRRESSRGPSRPSRNGCHDSDTHATHSRHEHKMADFDD